MQRNDDPQEMLFLFQPSRRRIIVDDDPLSSPLFPSVDRSRSADERMQMAGN
jgi:hypothetical protein